MGECQPAKLLVTWHQSALAVRPAAAVLVGGALWSMRRRDVT